MENAEVEVALEELENRLERLRALYEQYFMGIERIEPAIPRKDVDRRIYVLRREKIRNTAKRFKLQTIISRYNTFQQYWSRICREIEAGTYKRHVIRAERIAPGKMLTIAARKRLGRAALAAAEPDPESAPPPAPATPGPATAPAAATLAAVQAEPAAPPALSAAQAPRVRPASLRPGPPPRALPPPKPPARPLRPSVPASPTRHVPETLDALDTSALGDPAPGPSLSALKRTPDVPARPFGRALTQPLGAGAATRSSLGSAPLRAKPGILPAPPPPPRAPAPEPHATSAGPAARPVVAPRPPPPPPSAVGLVAPSLAVARPATPARPGFPPDRPPPPPRAAATGLATPPTRAPVPQPGLPRPPPPAPKATIVSKPMLPAPAAARPAPSAIPARPPANATALAAPIARPAPPKPAAPATDERVRALHARLVEAKRQTQDTGAVSMEGLARSMKATEAKLREQHQNRKIDFDVVIKDGKAVLKPIVR